MSNEEFLGFTDCNKLVFVELICDFEMRLWFEYGDFVDVHCYEDGFSYTYQGEYYERKDSSKLASDLIKLDPKYMNDMIKKYANESYAAITDLIMSKTLP